MSKYDWSEVPKEVQWIATNADGYRTKWSEKPRARTAFWHGGTGTNLGSFWPNDQYTIANNWYESLEQRPQVPA